MEVEVSKVGVDEQPVVHNDPATQRSLMEMKSTLDRYEEFGCLR